MNYNFYLWYNLMVPPQFYVHNFYFSFVMASGDATTAKELF